MKQRFLPIGILTLLITGLIVFVISKAEAQKTGHAVLQDESVPVVNDAHEYMAKIRSNQNTGLINPEDVIESREQVKARTSYKSSNQEFNWENLGPENIGGRTRALIFDNRDASGKTMYAGSTAGGIYKSTNQGSTWFKVNLGAQEVLNVSCMIQADNGTIYVGTGESSNIQTYSEFGMLGYEGGFMGKGIFKSGTGDNFTFVPGTGPVANDTTGNWAYINQIAIDKSGNRLFAATNTGLKYAAIGNLGTWNSAVKRMVDSTIITRTINIDTLVVCDSVLLDTLGNLVEIYGANQQIDVSANDTVNQQVIFSDYLPFENQGNCYSVIVGPEGRILTTIDNRIYVSQDGDPGKFVNCSKATGNPDSYRKELITYNTSYTLRDISGTVYESGQHTKKDTLDWNTGYFKNLGSLLANYPPNENAGRTVFAQAPSKPTVVYAMVANSVNSKLAGIFISEDNGITWNTVVPGGSVNSNILGGQYGLSNNPHYYYMGNYSGCLTVFPQNEYRILACGVNIWLGNKPNETGYFQVYQKSFSNSTILLNGIFDENYVHDNQFACVFKPGSDNTFFACTDGGIYQGTVYGTSISFQARNKKYTTSQFYSIAVTSSEKEYVGGTQDNGTLYGDGKSGTGKEAVDIWRYPNVDPRYPYGTTGGSVAFSNIRKTGIEVVDPPVFYSKSKFPESEDLTNRMRRSETLGFDYSSQYIPDNVQGDDINNDNFITPVVLWENYNNESSRDSVKFVANQNYEAGATVMVRSANYGHPFNYTLPAGLQESDTIMVKDIITARLFIGTTDQIWMSHQILQFGVNPEWYRISDVDYNGFEGDPLGMDVSKDGNYLFVGTLDGRLFRMSNISGAFSKETADVRNSGCIISTNEIMIIENGDTLSQAITSISVDPTDANKVMITCGNYGNNSYVFYSTNALSDNPQFVSVQGTPATTGLPRMPVYCGVLEMDPNTNLAIVGTEEGLWASDNVGSGEWYYCGGEMGRLPVMDITQQRYYKPPYAIGYVDPVTNETSYEIYPATKNLGDIYVGTFGRGVYRLNMDYVGIEDNPAGNEAASGNLDIYPNPSFGNLNVKFELFESQVSGINIYDLAGRIVISEDLGTLNKGQHEIPVSTSTLNKGSYILQLITGDTIQTNKVIIIK